MMKDLMVLGGFVVIGIWLTGIMKKLDQFLEEFFSEEDDPHP